MFHCRDVLAVLVPPAAGPPDRYNEPLGQIGLSILVDSIAHRTGSARSAAAASTGAFPRTLWVGLANPSAIVAAGAKPHSRLSQSFSSVRLARYSGSVQYRLAPARLGKWRTGIPSRISVHHPFGPRQCSGIGMTS
jgi:hypothetical protein